MPTPDYSTWLTKQQAAEAIGVSTKTVEKLAQEKKIQQACWKRPETGANVSVYHPDDADRLRKERNPDAPPFVVPAEKPVEPRALVAPPSANEFLRALAAALAGASENSQSVSDLRISERLFVTLSEAAQYSGLPRSHVRGLIKENKLEALKTGAGWRIRRSDLEKL